MPAPDDDGAAAHLPGLRLPACALPATVGGSVDLASLTGLLVVFVYPMTGHPDRALPAGWDMIPGARGCTPQACAFRDLAAELRDVGVAAVFGVSVQTPAEQAEAAVRLHLPFPLLSDEAGNLARALRLPTFEADKRTVLKRLTLVVRDARIERVFYPVFPPDRNAADVLAYLERVTPPR